MHGEARWSYEYAIFRHCMVVQPALLIKLCSRDEDAQAAAIQKVERIPVYMIEIH